MKNILIKLQGVYELDQFLKHTIAVALENEIVTPKTIIKNIPED